MTGILYALIPAVAWGSIVLVTVKLGGDPYSQTLGTTFGALIFSIVMYFFVHPNLSSLIWIVGLISGVFWAIGQKNQLGSVKYLGVSNTVPISTGMQLVATTLFGVLVFHEWSGLMTIIIGSIAVLVITVGVIFTSIRDKSGDNEKGNKNLKKGVLILLLSTAGYLVYVVIIRWFKIDGWSAILPQAVGMVIGAMVLTFRHHPFTKYAFRNTLSGFLWGIGNLGLLLALPRIGVATSFPISQSGIIISTFGGILILHEKKTKRQLVFIIIGSLLIIIGGVLLGYTKAH